MFEGSQSSGFWVKVVKVVRDIGARLKKYRTLTQSSVIVCIVVTFLVNPFSDIMGSHRNIRVDTHIDHSKVCSNMPKHEVKSRSRVSVIRMQHLQFGFETKDPCMVPL